MKPHAQFAKYGHLPEWALTHVQVLGFPTVRPEDAGNDKHNKYFICRQKGHRNLREQN